jgi:type II secretion system protein N
MKRLFFAGIIAAIILYGLWIIVVPEDFMQTLIENSLRDNNLHIETTGFHKGLFYNFTSQNITLKKSQATLISIDNVAGRINPLTILLMRLTLSFNGDISGGKMSGKVNLLKGKHQVAVYCNNAHVDAIPFLSGAGFSGKGILSGEFLFKDKFGELKFSITDARFYEKSFSGITVPLNVFHSVRGAMTINGDIIKIVSFSLEGRGIYARIKGNIRGGNMDLTMEIMPDSSFTGNSYIFSMIDNYKVSPGYYVIPIKSTISF